jgi:hypothetical protein
LPSTQSEPFPLQSLSALQPATVTAPSEPSPPLAASLPVLASFVVALSEPVPASLPPSDTHSASPFESLQTYPVGHPVVLQSLVSSPASGVYDVPGVQVPWSQTYPSSQSLFCEHDQLMQAPEYVVSGQL